MLNTSLFDILSVRIAYRIKQVLTLPGGSSCNGKTGNQVPVELEEHNQVWII